MKKRVFSTNAGDRIEFTTAAEAVSSRSNVALSILVTNGLGTVEVFLTPKEATRFMELVHDVDADVWADEMGECRDHELTGHRCPNCGRYCGTRKRCPHCAPRPK